MANFSSLVANGRVRVNLDVNPRSVFRNVRIHQGQAWAIFLPSIDEAGNVPVRLEKGPVSYIQSPFNDEMHVFLHPDISSQPFTDIFYDRQTCEVVSGICTTCTKNEFLEPSPFGAWDIITTPSPTLENVERIRLYFRVTYTQAVGAPSEASSNRMFASDPCPKGTCFTNTNMPSQSECQPENQVIVITSCPVGQGLYGGEYQPCPDDTYSNSTQLKCSAHSSVCDEGTHFEATLPSATSDRICQRLRDCSIGSFVSTPPSTTSDRECRACDNGKFSNTLNAPSCRPWVTCPYATYEGTMPTRESDRVYQACTICMDGYQSLCTQTDDAVCKNSVCTPCQSGTYASSPCSAGSPAVCRACTACGSHQFQVSECAAASDRVCFNCRRCTAGEYEIRPCQLTADRICRALTSCQSGQYEEVPATPTSDSVCRAITTCSAKETEFQGPTKTSDRICTQRATTTVPVTTTPAADLNAGRAYGSDASGSSSKEKDYTVTVVAVSCGTIVVLIVAIMVFIRTGQRKATATCAPLNFDQTGAANWGARAMMGKNETFSLDGIEGMYSEISTEDTA